MPLVTERHYFSIFDKKSKLIKFNIHLFGLFVKNVVNYTFKISKCMVRETRVAVFESEKAADLQIIKNRLAANGIESYSNDKYMTFTTTPTANTIRLMVELKDEAKAFEIIDAYLQQKETNENQ